MIKARHDCGCGSGCKPLGVSQHHAGYTLVLFAMLMFGLMGMAALVIDIGFARLTQRQMQTAVDSAAIEGLRFRDDPGLPEADRDEARRQRASDLVAMIFDDDLDPGNGDDGAFDSGGQFGAGPVIDLSGGVGDPIMNASQLITIPTTTFYKPVVELNRGNEIHGDLVAGNCIESDADHYEATDYDRTDFDLTEDTAFLARMRRTNDFDGLDSIAGESTSGPTIPYLFGRGSLLAFRDPAVTYSPRHHGMTVRATGIADARPVVTVGKDYPGVLVGSQVFAMSTTIWSSLERDDSNPLTDESAVIPVDGLNAGSLVSPLQHIGQIPALLTAPIAIEGFVPIFHDINGTNRVVGFGLASVTVESVSEVRIRKRVLVSSDGVIATENATATLNDAWNELGLLSEIERADVLTQNRSFPHPLLAPVSVR